MIKYAHNYTAEASNYFNENNIQDNKQDFSEELVRIIGEQIKNAHNILTDIMNPEQNYDKDIKVIEETIQTLNAELEVPIVLRNINDQEIQGNINNAQDELKILKGRKALLDERVAASQDDIKVITCSLLAQENLFYSEPIIDRVFETIFCIQGLVVLSKNNTQTTENPHSEASSSDDPSDEELLELAIKLSLQEGSNPSLGGSQEGAK